MDTSAKINQELRNVTAERKKQGGHRCLGKQRDGSYALSVGIATGSIIKKLEQGEYYNETVHQTLYTDNNSYRDVHLLFFST